jgi:predicted ATP-grasp superfamily ATP-dependent carboligase
MTRILLVEYLTAGAVAAAGVPPGLAAEGLAMWRALARDLAALPGVTVASPVARELLTAGAAGGAETRQLDLLSTTGPAGFPEALRAGLATADRALLVAPETDGCLLELTRLALGLGVPLLGCGAAAVAVATSKRRTHAALVRAGLPVVPVFGWEGPPPASAAGYVVKPDDGCGAEGVRYLPDFAALAAWRATGDAAAALDSAPADRGMARAAVAGAAPASIPIPARSLAGYILTPYCPGEAVSLTLLTDGRHCRVLAANRQHLARGRLGEMGLRAVTVNALGRRREDFAALAEALVRAIPGCFGVLGVDGILQDDMFLAVDVNPRITTAYGGLAASLGVNPMALLWDLLAGGQAWRQAPLGAEPVAVPCGGH